MQKLLFFGLSVWLLGACTPPSTPPQDALAPLPSISGRPAYLASPYVTAGDRLYVSGHQDGSFPDFGWHVPGEMGGIWDHPIKLMDGFALALIEGGDTTCLSPADEFINYPMANLMRYLSPREGLRVERLQWVPDGEEAAVITFTVHNQGQQEREVELLFNGFSDLRPVWLGERTRMKNGQDFIYYNHQSYAMVAKDGAEEWYATWGSRRQPQAYLLNTDLCEKPRQGKGANGALSYALRIPPQQSQRLEVVIAGSYQSELQARETLQRVQANSQAMLEAKVQRYQQLAQTAQLEIPDARMQQAYQWLKYNTDWLIREVPEQGRGLSAGLVDYPWWFGCDNAYALQGVLATGRRDIVFSTIDLLRDLSEQHNGNGRIVHEVSTNGAVYHPGNINETPQFVSLIWATYAWTGDTAFLAEYYPFVQRSLDWLMQQGDEDGNLLPDGPGMMEIHGLASEMIDVAVYTQKAFADARRMAQQMGDRYKAIQYGVIADSLARKINEAFWVEDFDSYADFIGTTAEARALIEDAIVRADTLNKPWAVAELEATRRRIARYPARKKQGFVLHHNWVVNTPMETGVADSAQALAALNTGARFVNPFGVFVTGIDRDETAGQDAGSFAEGKKVFSYTGAVMTLPTGVQAIAENNYGRPDSALGYLQRLVSSFSYALPGSMYEVSPDFGMMAQAWNVYALAVPLVQQFLGVQPRAYAQTVRLSPQLPSDWPYATLRDLPVGDNRLDLHVERFDGGLRLDVQQSRPEWQVEVAFPAGRYATWTVNGELMQPETRRGWDCLTLSGSEPLTLELGSS